MLWEEYEINLNLANLQEHAPEAEKAINSLKRGLEQLTIIYPTIHQQKMTKMLVMDSAKN